MVRITESSSIKGAHIDSQIGQVKGESPESIRLSGQRKRVQKTSTKALQNGSKSPYRRLWKFVKKMQDDDQLREILKCDEQLMKIAEAKNIKTVKKLVSDPETVEKELRDFCTYATVTKRI